jgi:hypothetical protein
VTATGTGIAKDDATPSYFLTAREAGELFRAPLRVETLQQPDRHRDRDHRPRQVYILSQEANRQRRQRRAAAGRAGHISTSRGRDNQLCPVPECEHDVEKGRETCRSCRAWFQRNPGARWDDRAEMLRSKTARISRNRPRKGEDWGDADVMAGRLGSAVVAELKASLGPDGARRYLRDLELRARGFDSWEFKRNKAPARPVDWSASAEKKRTTEIAWGRWDPEKVVLLTDEGWRPPKERKRGVSGNPEAKPPELDPTAVDGSGVPTKVNTHAAEHWMLGLRWFNKTMVVPLKIGKKRHFVVTHTRESLRDQEQEAEATRREDVARARARRAAEAARRAAPYDRVVVTEIKVKHGALRIIERKVTW